MKRLLLTLLCLLFVYPCFAGEPMQLARMNPYVAGAAIASGTDYTNCSQIGTAQLYWGGDNSGTSGTTVGCTGSDGTHIHGTLENNASVFAASPASPLSGGNALKLTTDAWSQLNFKVTSGDIVNGNEGRATLYGYATALTNSDTVFYVAADANNYIKVKIDSGGYIELERVAGGVVYSVSSYTDSMSITTWTKIQLAWSVSNNIMSIKLGTGSVRSCTASCTGMNNFSTSATDLNIGGSTRTDEMWVDDMWVWTSYSAL